MTCKKKSKIAVLTGKGLIVILALNLLLTNSIMAGKKAGSVKKDQSTKTLRSMARVYMAYGEYAKAQPFAEKALKLARSKGASDSELSMCLIDLGTLYSYQGNLDEAEEVCKLGLQYQKKVLYKNHPYIAHTLRILSSIYQQQEKYAEAQSVLDNAMTIMLDSHGADDKAIAPFFVDVAKLYVAQDALEKAENYYHKAMDLINDSYGPNHLYTANVLCSIAELYTLQEKYTEAEDSIDRAILVQEKIYGSDHHLIAGSWLTKAKICRVNGQFAQAEELISRALNAIENSGNSAALSKLQQDVKKIRVSKQLAFVPIKKTIE